jgi:hypothetical protein
VEVGNQKIKVGTARNFFKSFLKAKHFALLSIIFFTAITFSFTSNIQTANAQIPVCPTCVPTDAPVANYFLGSIAVDERSQTTKEFSLDGIATQAAKLVIGEMTEAIVTWINRGFEGGPVFVTDPAAFFTDVGDQIAGDFIAGTELGFLCEPFALDIRLALNLSYNNSYTLRNYCRLSDVIANTENFAKFTSGDFSQGGWDSWFQITQNPSNNPVGAYAAAQAELSLRTASGRNIELSKLNWGEGFLSSKECVAENQNGDCIEYKINTPGSVINDQLGNALGTSYRQLELADEFNEIVGALIGQLTQTVLTEGLSSFSRGGSNQNYLNRPQNENPPLTVVCSPSQEEVERGEEVTWTANVFGGIPGTNAYEWRGSGQVNRATTRTVTVTYANPGIKTAQVEVTRTTGGGQVNIEDCEPNVVVR